MLSRLLAMGIVVVLTAGFGATPGVAQNEDGAMPAAQNPSLVAILDRLSENPYSPEQYGAKITLKVKLKIFPWISIRLNGNSFYKRPGLYRFVFRGVPKAAESFHNLTYDLGTPNAWPDKYDIALQSAPSDGHDAVVRLTPKKAVMVKYLDVSIDPISGHMDKAVWSRNDGGTITLVQKYVPIGEKLIVSHQEAEIAIPHMRAELSADYSDFDQSASEETFDK